MELTKEQALAIGLQVMSDIGYDHWDKDDSEGPAAMLIDSDKDPISKGDYWIVSFPFGKEDYGENVLYMIIIPEKEKVATNITYRNGHIELGYDSEEDRYFIAERRP